MAYIPLAMNASTLAGSNIVGAAVASTALLQAANVGDKILVLWPTRTRAFGGTTSGFTNIAISGCTVGTIRNVYNGTDRHYFCWVTITSASWSFQFRETSYIYSPYITLYYQHQQSCSNSGVTKIPTSSISVSKINTEFNSGTGNVGLSGYKEGNKVPNTHTNMSIPEQSGSVSMSNFGGAAKHSTSTQAGGDSSLSRLSSIVFTSATTGSTTTTSHEKAGTLYTHNYSYGFSAGTTGTVTNGYIAKGSAVDKKSSTEGPLVNGFGNRTNYGSANFVRIATSTYTSNNNAQVQAADKFHIRLHTDESSSGFEGTGRSTGAVGGSAGSGSSTVADYDQIFMVATDDTCDEYHMWDIDSCTVTNYTQSGNDYSDIIWTNDAMTLVDGQEYIMLFLQWDV